MLSALASTIEHPFDGKLTKAKAGERAEELAKKTIDFLRGHLWADGKDGKKEFYRSWREGRGHRGQCEDYAYVVQGQRALFPLFAVLVV
jgi:uncharacterized protein YyaL (SSP411 family)